MAIGDTLRKAAGLFIVLDESSGAGSGTPEPVAASDAPDEIDRRLAAMNASIAQLSSGSATPPPIPPSALPLPLPTAPTRTVADLLRETSGPAIEEVRVDPASVGPPPLGPDGALDFAALYTAAALPATPFSAEQTIAMLGQLPANLPLDMKRQTVSVMLSTMGATTGVTAESIVADTTRKLAALASYSQSLGDDTRAFVAATDSEIAALTAQIDTLKTRALEAKERLATVEGLCQAEADRLDDVLEFFSLDTGPSRYAGEGTNEGGTHGH
jgi:hypothetical protein